MDKLRYYAPYDLKRATEDAVGLDLRATLGLERQLAPGRRWKVPTGLHLAIPPGYGAQVVGRSGLAIDHGIVVVTGTIDRDYRGEVAAIVINHGSEAYTFVPGERVAQIVFFVQDVATAAFGACERPERVGDVAELGDTARGAAGFGSTGR